MPIRKRRDIRRLHQILEDWINEDFITGRDFSDSSDSDHSGKFSLTNRIKMTKDMEEKAAHLSPNNEKDRQTSEDERTSSRSSNASSSATEHLPPPPKYEAIVGDRQARDYFPRTREWDRDIAQIVDDFGRKVSTSARDHDKFSTMPSRKRQSSSGAMSSSRQEGSHAGLAEVPRSSSTMGFDRDSDWNRRMALDDDFFGDSRLRTRFDRPFGITSRFGDDIDRFFGRSSEWDTFFPEIRFPEFGRSSRLGESSLEKKCEVPVKTMNENFAVEVDVQGFEPEELLVKTVGQTLIVMAKSEVKTDSTSDTGANHSVRELRREFTIPSNVNPLDVASRLTPEGVLVVEAPTREKLSITTSEGGKIKNPE